MKRLVSLILTLSACSVSAAVIGFNFTSDWPSPTIGGETADGFSQWTDSVDEAAPGTGTEVPNSTDPWAVTTPVNAPMVSVAWNSANMWSAGSESNADQGLYRVYLDDGGGVTITVSGLAAWLNDAGDTEYEVRFYRSSDNTADFAALNIHDGSTTGGTVLETIPVMTPSGDGAYPTGTGSGGDRMFQDTAGTFAADTITFHSTRDGANRASIAGFKITSVPEPATGLLTAMALGLASVVRRRR